MVSSVNISDLNSLYTHLESNAFDYEYGHQIGDLFQKIKLLNDENNNQIESEKAQWEVDFFYFDINSGILNSAMSQTSEMGKINKYPDLDKFDDNTYTYLINRLDNSNTPLLKARYATILWNSPKRHRKYAEIAVDSFMDLVKIYEEKNKEDPNENYDVKVVEAVKNAYKIAFQSQYKRDEIKSEIKRLITQFNSKNSIYRFSLIELMLNEKKNFSKNDFIGISDVLWNASKLLNKSDNTHGAIDTLEIGQKVENKTGENKYNWKIEIAKSYEILMKASENKGDLATIYFCQKALEYYKIIKDDVKISEMEEKYASLKSTHKLAKIETPVDLTETFKEIEKITENLVQKEPDEIIKYLMYNDNIIPKYKKTEEFVEKLHVNHPMLKLVPVAALDKRGHVAQRFSKPEEIKYHAILGQFQIELELLTVNLLNEVLIRAIIENKLSYDILLKYFIDNSWFGKTISKPINDKTIEYNWLDMIAPALFEYFNQITFYLLNPSNIPNFVLVIDSLILKIEGLLRDICENCGVATFYQTQDKNGGNITREKSIDDLLRDDALKKLFNENELLLFKFLLVEKAGYNFRHQVAHSLLQYRDYNIGIAHLLLLIILRIGKFDFSEEVIKENP